MESVTTSQSGSATVVSNNQSSCRGTRTDNAGRSNEEDSTFVPVVSDDSSTSRNINHFIGDKRKEQADVRHEEKSRVGSTALLITSRNLKRCCEVSSRAGLVPTKNLESFDFDKEVRELRGLYKLCGSAVGQFRPTTTDRTDSSIVDPARKSNEW